MAAVSIAWLLGAAPAHAQATPPARPPTAPEPKTRSEREQLYLQYFRMLDANKDGRISRDEGRFLLKYKPSLAEDFKQADVNHDGYLTEQEVRGLAERRRVERQARRQREAAGKDAAAPQAAAPPAERSKPGTRAAKSGAAAAAASAPSPTPAAPVSAR